MDVEDAQYHAKKMKRIVNQYMLFDFNKMVDKIKERSKNAYKATWIINRDITQLPLPRIGDAILLKLFTNIFYYSSRCILCYWS